MQTPAALTDAPKTTVFYDGSCPLCSKEINHYMGLRGAENIEWIDIARNRNRLKGYALDFDEAMARFHVLDTESNWQTGAHGFIEMWLHLPAYRWLALTLKKLRLVVFLDKAYTRFAAWRLRRQCDAGSCDTRP